jgi:hypothetical protein
VVFNRPICRLFRNGIIASGMAAILSTQLHCPSVAYAAEPTAAVTDLSPAALQVSRIADRNGDQNFLLLDKTAGRIIAFEHGTPTFSGAALTGESLTDIIPQDAFSKSFAETRGLKYKVTPAGRFTVSPGFDPAYGETLDVNEVHGRDWDISIHRVWLGAPAEHRDVRLRTATGQDKHITYGCIDVDADTMHQLLRHVSHGARLALYILPVDEHLVSTLFAPHDFVRDAAMPGVQSGVRVVSGTPVR